MIAIVFSNHAQKLVKKDTKHSSNTLLCLVSYFTEWTLVCNLGLSGIYFRECTKYVHCKTQSEYSIPENPKPNTKSTIENNEMIKSKLGTGHLCLDSNTSRFKTSRNFSTIKEA